MRSKEIIKKFLPKKIFYFIKDIIYPEKIDVLEKKLNSLFVTHYQSLAGPDLSQKKILENSEFKVFSKHGCDGLLLYIYSKIGTTNHIFVEMGIENGRECNTANLSLNFGWKGLLIDANKDWVESAKRFYKTKLGDNADNVKVTACFVTAENINKVLSDNDIRGEIDLLSLDIDGNDYWVWKAIDVINPRVVVVEYNAVFGFKSLVQKYSSDFSVNIENPLYFGASVSALAKLGKSKGYILIGCDSHGHDAFFVRSDVAKGKIAQLSAEEAFHTNPYNIKNMGDIDTQFEQIKHFDFDQI